jgi:hypothetical protein
VAESFNALELDAKELQAKLVDKRDNDKELNHVEHRALFVCVDMMVQITAWLSMMSSDEFDKNHGGG